MPRGDDGRDGHGEEGRRESERAQQSSLSFAARLAESATGAEEASRASSPASDAPENVLQHPPPPMSDSSEKLRGEAELDADMVVRTDRVVMTPTRLQELLELRLQAYMPPHIPTFVKGTVTTITEGLAERVNALAGRRKPQATARSTASRIV